MLKKGKFMEILNIINDTFKAPSEVKDYFKGFVESHPETFNSRENEVGHITCSMLVMDESRENVLLTTRWSLG
jgi:hypothetical protein